MSDAAKCKHAKPDGTSCNAFSLSGEDFCFHHSPSRQKERAEARRKGGRARNRPAVVLPMTTPDAQIENVDGVVSLLGETINQVRRGSLDPKIGHTVGYLSGILLKALEGNELAKQLDEQAEQLTALRGEMEAMRRERHTQKTATAAANGAGGPAKHPPTQPAARGDSGRRSGDHDEDGEDSGFLAEGLAPFFE